MNRDKQIKKAVTALAKLHAEGYVITNHAKCGNGVDKCWEVSHNGVLHTFAVIGSDGEVWV